MTLGEKIHSKGQMSWQPFRDPEWTKNSACSAGNQGLRFGVCG